MKFGPFIKRAFVVEGPDGFRCLGSRLLWAPDTDSEVPVMSFGDAGDERFRYVVAPEEPDHDDAGNVTWHNVAGGWRARPLRLSDTEWVSPGREFADLDSLQEFANDAALACLDSPGDEDENEIT